MTPYENTFVARSGLLTTVRINLNVGEPATGIVDVKTIPPGATILADGKPIEGQTPTSFSLAAGEHTLIVSHAGYRPVRQTVEVKANGTLQVDIRMSR